MNSNRIFALIILTGIIFSLYCCSNKNAQNSGKYKLKFAPPGTNHLFGNIFIDETEISNMTWREYLYWTKKVYGGESPEFNSILPDTLVWRNCYKDFPIKTNQDRTDVESLIYLYLRHPQFNHFPVVGISFEQATRFCTWRTNRVNEALYVNKHKNITFPIDSSIVIPKNVIFRLPSEEEWEYAAKVGIDSAIFMDLNVDKLQFNTLETSQVREVKQTYDKFTPLSHLSLQPDKYNRSHLIGNVAEMTNIKGISKGGSYIHSIKDSYYSKEILYSAPTYWLGFRCVCEILPDHK